jgi:hypothetical protein
MLQLVCEIFLAIFVVFLVYLAFRKIFAVTYLKNKREDLEKKSDSNGNNRDITKH